LILLFGLFLDKGVVDPEDTLNIEEEKVKMKKLFLIFSAVVVLIAFAVPAFAMEMYDPEQRAAKLYEEQAAVLKASGELTFGAISPFASDEAAIGFANMYVDFTLWPDEYNSVLIEVSGQEAFGVPAANTAELNYFEMSTDVGAYFGLPVGLKNTAGVTSLYTNKYEVTGHAYERTLIRTAIDPLAWKFLVDAGMVQLNAALGFGEFDATGEGVFNDIGVYAYIPDIAGVAEAEVWYLAQDDPDYKGKFGFSVKADGLVGGMIGVAAGFMYDVTDAAEAAGLQWNWGAGVSVDYMMAAIGISANGHEVNTLNQAAIDVDLAFGDFGLVGTAALFNDAGGDLTFWGGEIAGYLSIGNSTWKVGYEITDTDAAAGEAAYAYSPSVANATGGVFLNADIDF
jgi:hypothetical protein